MDGGYLGRLQKRYISYLIAGEKCLKGLNLLSFSRKTSNDSVIMCMSTQQEKTEIFLAFKFVTCIRSCLVCLFITLSISKLEIKFIQTQEVCRVVL